MVTSLHKITAFVCSGMEYPVGEVGDRLRGSSGYHQVVLMAVRKKPAN